MVSKNLKYCESITNYIRRKSRVVNIGDIPLWTKCMISLRLYQKHKSRIQWIGHPPQADIPFEYWIHE